MFGARGESTYCGLSAVTFRLQRAGQKPRPARGSLGQRSELVIGAIPLDLLVELIAGGRGADAQVLD